MAYTRKRRASSARSRNTRRARPVRRRATGVRRRTRAASGRRSGGQHTIRLVLVQETKAGEGMGGLDMPQVQTQTKKARF